MNPLIRIAVPIFFMISGYFMLSSDGTISLQKLKRTFVKILKFTVETQIVYFLFCLLSNIRHSQEFIAYLMSITTLLKGIFIGGAFSDSLWYLTAMLEAIIVIWLLVKYRLTRLLPILAIIGLVLNFTFGYFYPEKLPLPVHRNFITIAIPALYIGMVIRLNEHRIVLSCRQLIIILVGLIVLEYIKKYYFDIYHGGDIRLLTIPIAIAVFLIALKWDVVKDNLLARIGREHSSNIYFYHLLIWNIIGIVIWHTPLSWCKGSINEVAVFIVYLLAIPLSFCINALRRRYGVAPSRTRN